MLIEISEAEARDYIQNGQQKVFAHSFEPFEVDHFDNNGFQQWNTDGVRFEASRFFIDVPEIEDSEVERLYVRVRAIELERNTKQQAAETHRKLLASRVSDADRTAFQKLWDFLLRRGNE